MYLVPFVLFSFLTVAKNKQIDTSEEENNCVYRNLYGCKAFNYSLVESLEKLTEGALKFLIDDIDLLSKETKDSTPEFNEEYDFIIVGAGSAGSTIAARLSEIDDVSVLLIEAGGDEHLFYDVPLGVQYIQFNPLVNWQYKTEPSDTYCLGTKGRRCDWPRGRVMGGSSVLNYMVATRGHRLDYDGWAEMGNTGWSYNDTLKYFLKLEEIGIPELREDKKFHNTKGPLYISDLSFHTPVATAFLKSGVEQGYPIIDYNGEKRIGYSYAQCTIKNGERMSTNRAYLYPNRKRRNLKVSKYSHADKVLIDTRTKRAYGVEFTKSGRRIRVKARKEIVLSAGAIGSPKLLMLSGVGPRDHLQEMKIELIQDAPVGKNLMDHIFYPGLVFLIDQPVGLVTADLINPVHPYFADYLRKRKGPLVIPGGVEALAFVDTDQPNNLDAYPNIEQLFIGSAITSDPVVRFIYGMSNNSYWDETFASISGKYSWSILPVLMHPRSRGELLLKNKDPMSKPKLIANYFEDSEDLRVMVSGIRATIEVSKTKAMQRFKSKVFEAQIPGCEIYKYDSDDYWGCAARTYSTTLFHQSGTCKMAPKNDPTGVVNPRLQLSYDIIANNHLLINKRFKSQFRDSICSQVKGIKRLRVADASIMPTIITGHANIPTVMIAEKLADMIKEDWGYDDAK